MCVECRIDVALLLCVFHPQKILNYIIFFDLHKKFYANISDDADHN